LAALLAVFGGGALVHLSVTVGGRFEGRLWKLPSRILSDVLVLGPGDIMDAERLSARLDRSGYARVDAEPVRPGQYRRRGPGLDLYARGFVTPEARFQSRRVVLRFSGEELRSLSDPAGRRVGHVVVEPELLATLFGARHEERRLLPLEETPPIFVRAVLAAEDSRFYSHRGVDVRGILRAGWTNLRHGRIVQGGSTVTQQTVKNLFLNQERTWWRKLREAAMSLVLDARYEKDRILEVYLNEVYLGQRGAVAICGAQAASRFYFGRDLADLSVGEAAMLAGLISSPGTYNPFKFPDRALARRDRVLEAMLDLGWIDAATAAEAGGEPLRLASGSQGYAGAAYVVDFVRRQLTEIYTPRILEEEGLDVYTTVDTRLQENATRALARGLERLEDVAPRVRRQQEERALQGAVVMLRPSSGEIVAMVGGKDYDTTQFNRAVQARRQPGSCFKPFVFAAAFERERKRQGSGLTPATLLEDAPLDLVVAGKSWSPENYDREFRGWVSARRVLEESLNVPTVRASQRLGVDNVIEAARTCGITSPLSEVPSLPLGTEEVTPLELATAYATFADAGMRGQAWSIRAVVDRQGRLLERRRPPRERAISRETAFLVSDLLRGVFVRGTARSALGLGLRVDAAGKTGTTDDLRDAWFVGFTPDLLALVWVGYDDNASTGLTGATGALPIWADLMNRSSPVSRPGWFAQPANILRRNVDPGSGQLAVKACPRVFEEVFLQGSEPTEPCELHQGPLKRLWRKMKGKRGAGTTPAAD
jgi:penicillin-binding protein 1B